MTSMLCPEPERLQALASPDQPAADRAAIARHAEGCDTCRAAIVAVFGTQPEVRGGRELAPGSALDRYVIERRLGAGAMGVVYEARDPALDRRVAIKLLRPGTDREALRARLSREAQALARIDHPNVVAVHDTGTFEGDVFIVMDLVRGVTLRQWVARDRPWQDVLATLLAAARGLAAAHAAGLVHRDFKPDNVLIGDDGRVRVSDFGLARTSADATAAAVDAETRPDSSSSLDHAITHTGVLVGTPVYAAPEQLVGRRTGPPGDQFSFCVTAYEALYGRRPFAAADVPELIERVFTGEATPPADPRGVPARIHRALLRGLRPRISDRYASMDALIDALSPSRRRRWIAGGALAVAGIAIAIAVWSTFGGAAPAPCAGLDERIPARLAVGADDATRVWLNGALIDDERHAWQDPRVHDVHIFGHPSRTNVIAIEGINLFSQGGIDRGVIVDLSYETGGVKHSVITDRSWRTSTTPSPGWTEPGFDDAGWSPGFEIGRSGIWPWGEVLSTVLGLRSSASWIWSSDPSGPPHAKPVEEHAGFRRTFHVVAPGCS